MNELEQLEMLRFILQSQREESLEHRKSIHSAFGLSLVGLAAILAGVIAASNLPTETKWVIFVAVIALSASTLAFMRQQRQESEIGMQIVRRIEKRLLLYDKGTYFDDESVFPPSFQHANIDEHGFSPGDKVQVTSLLIFTILIGVVLYLS